MAELANPHARRREPHRGHAHAQARRRFFQRRFRQLQLDQHHEFNTNAQPYPDANPNRYIHPLQRNSVALPGTVQTEDFDNGGQGVAFNYARTGNNGAGYRDTAITLERTTDTGGGYDVGRTLAGESLNFTVNIAQTAKYTLGLRVATGGRGGTVHIESDGTDISGPTNITNTGSWQSWKTLTVPGVSLTAGKHVFKLVIDSTRGGEVANFNWMSIGG